MEDFLLDRFGKTQGERIYIQQQERLRTFVDKTYGKSKNQMKTLKTAILPRIALYQVLQEVPMEKRIALKTVEAYFTQYNHKNIQLIKHAEKLPLFFKIFRTLFSNGLKSDNWDVTIEQNDAGALIFTIKKCLWCDTCTEYGCPELCAMFCNSDDAMFGQIKKMDFQRSKTLGKGGDCCDFRFRNNQVKSAR